MIGVKFSLLGVFFLFSCRMMAQSEGYTADVIESGIRLTQYGGVLIGKKMPPPEIEGDPYLFEGFILGDIKLQNEEVLENIMLNVDLYNEILITNNEEDFYSVDLKDIHSIYALGKVYINTSQQGILGVSELVYNGEQVKIFNNQKLKVKDPTYIPGVDMGNRNMQIYKKQELFLLFNNQIYPVRKKSDIMNIFSGNENFIQHLKEKKIKPKKLNELIQALEKFEY